jgi:hypothetical protein
MENKKIIRSDNHVTIDGWMINELELSGSELIIYGLIWGFSQTENQWCTASQAYIARWANISTRGLRKILDKLEEKGLLIKETTTCKKGLESKYRAIRPSAEDQESDGNKVPIRPEQSSYPDGNKVPIRWEQSSYNNIEDNIDYNIADKKENKKRKTEPFKKPTLEEVTAYIQERKSPIDSERFYAYYESVGWIVGKKPMKNWKMAVITWEKRLEAERKEKNKPSTCGNNKSQEFMESEPF